MVEMDPRGNTLPGYEPAYPVLAQTPVQQRKRTRASDSPGDPNKVQEKREKARERQRRKRERDRQRESLGGMSAPGASADLQVPNDPAFDPAAQDLTPDELARRDKVRSAARERQRKHRALVKQRKMAELGMSMGNESMGSMEEMHYALGPDGQYQPILPPPVEMGQEPPFPQGHTGGQTFASTLLLSFSCSPLLKQHLLRTLHMSNEELASLEPVLSAAWDQWDHARRVHYAEQAAKAGVDHGGPSEPHPYGDPQTSTYDFRARFHRPLTAPSPFRQQYVQGAAHPQMQPHAHPHANHIVQTNMHGQPIAPQGVSSTSSRSPPEHMNNVAIDPNLSGTRDDGDVSVTDGEADPHDGRDDMQGINEQLVGKE